MPLVGSTTGDHLHLRPAGLVKVGSLTERADLEFFDRLDRRCYYPRGHCAGLGASETGEVLDVSDGVARHIVGVIAAIAPELVLIHVYAGDSASGRHSTLEPLHGCGLCA